MDKVFDALGDLIASSLSTDHWMFYCVAFCLSITGELMRTRVFTRERARRYFGASPEAKRKHKFYHWGYETLAWHPFAACLVLLLVWPDPEGKGWRIKESALAWLTTSLASLVLWTILKAKAKERGIILTLPGDSGGSFPPVALPASPAPANDTAPPPGSSDGSA